MDFAVVSEPSGYVGNFFFCVCVCLYTFTSCFLGSKLCRFHLNFSALIKLKKLRELLGQLVIWYREPFTFGTPGLQFIKVAFEPLMPCLPWSPSFFLFSQLLLMKSMCGNEDVCKSTAKSKFKIPRSLPSLVTYKIFNCTHLFRAHVFKINFILWIMKTVVQNCHSKI